MLPTERRAVGVIALIAMCRMFGLFALLPVLSIFASGLDGATPVLVGLAVGGYGLTQASLQIPFGLLSDRRSSYSVWPCSRPAVFSPD
jgi:MFS family permease